MNRKAVLDRLCTLVATVAENIYAGKVSFDCFCGNGAYPGPAVFSVDDKIVEFIEKAVLEKVGQEGKEHGPFPSFVPRFSTWACSSCAWKGVYADTLPVLVRGVDWQQCPSCRGMVVPTCGSVVYL